MNKTTKIILFSGALVAIIAVAVAVKIIWFPSVKDAWFKYTSRQLHLVPPGLVVVRETHFANGPTNVMVYARVRGDIWRAGRNVTLQQLMAMAYAYNPGRISLPANVPENNFDILITAPGDFHQKLKDLIQRQIGYTADVETQDADVLALKVVDQHPDDMTPSTPNEKQNEDFKNGKLYLKHMKLQDITRGLENFIKMPIVDETGMSNNFYDFTLDWKQGMNPNNFTRDDFDKILDGWGLKFEPDTASIDMLVVKRKY
jgi:uncharacterized protein (TIGR03435 family)